MTVAYILNELCGQAAAHRHRCIRTQRFHPSTGALKADTGHIKEH